MSSRLPVQHGAQHETLSHDPEIMTGAAIKSWTLVPLQMSVFTTSPLVTGLILALLSKGRQSHGHWGDGVEGEQIRSVKDQIVNISVSHAVKTTQL